MEHCYTKRKPLPLPRQRVSAECSASAAPVGDFAAFTPLCEVRSVPLGRQGLRKYGELHAKCA